MASARLTKTPKQRQATLKRVIAATFKLGRGTLRTTAGKTRALTGIGATGKKTGSKRDIKAAI